MFTGLVGILGGAGLLLNGGRLYNKSPLKKTTRNPTIIKPMGGFNLIQADHVPYGSAGFRQSLQLADSVGARVLAFIPFAWMENNRAARVDFGRAVHDNDLLQGIKQAHEQGFTIMLKPHIWVEGSWAGAIEPPNGEAWEHWFDAYERVILYYATLAQQAGCAYFAVGTELNKSQDHPRWPLLIERVRRVYRGKIIYVAHGIEGALSVPFWPLVDEIGITLYPKMGETPNEQYIKGVMQQTEQQIARLSARYKKPVSITEIGLMSAQNAQAEPWRSPEERQAPFDELLQAKILSWWIETLNKPYISHVLIWRWLTDPQAGGKGDIDFTPQHKKAEESLRHLWGG